MASFIPRSVLVPNVVLNSRSLELSNHLLVTLKQAGFAIQQVRPFIERLLCAICESGSIEGVAVRPSSNPATIVKGQVRRVFENELQPRSQPDASLLVLIGKAIVAETFASWWCENADEHENAKHLYQFAQDILTQCGVEVDRLAHDSARQALNRFPSRNHIFLLHYHTWGYPAYFRLGMRMHRGLVARISQVQNLPSLKQKKALGAYLTVAKAFVPVLSPDLLEEIEQAKDKWELGQIIRRAAERLHGIQPSTRQQYTNVFVHMLTQKAASSPFITKRKSRLGIRETTEDNDPDDIVEQGFDVREWITTHLADAKASDSVPLLEELEGLSSKHVEELVGLERDQVFTRSRFVRHRLVLERNIQVFSPGVASIGELTSYYTALLWKDKPHDWSSRFNQLSRLVFLDTLIHTGRSPEWLASLKIGAYSPEVDHQHQFRPTDAYSFFDAAHGSICYRRPEELYLPRGLQLPNSTDGSLFSIWLAKIREHDARYQHFEFIHELPLSESQLALFAKYVRLWDQAKNRFGLKRLARCKDEPFFLVADAKGLRPWQSADTQQLFTHISQWVKRLHPGWVSVQPSRLAKTFHAYYTSQFGFDPIYAAYISGIIPAELEQPIHYALVDSRQLQSRYWTAQNKFRRRLADEYAHVWKKYTQVELTWTVCRGIKPKLVRDVCFGSWRCPHREHLIWIIEQLTRMTNRPDEMLAHNARVTLLSLMLQLTLGLRPFEVTRLTRRTVDMYAGTILVVGKFNYAYESYRLLPIPGEMIALIRYALNENEKLTPRNGNTCLIQTYNDGAYRSARLMDIQLVWEQAAIESGKLRSEQIPELGSLRHFYRTFALKAGFPYQAVNALMGHQSGGCELYHPYLNQDTHQVLEVGMRLASKIATSVHFESQLVHLPK